MKHYGDITKINGAEIEPVDVITGGSPCQDLSVAGKRAGLAGERSGLFMEQIRIVKEMRAKEIANGRTDCAIRPRFMVWENVPGAFSSNQGKDFQAFLTEIVRIVEPDAPDVPMPEGGRWSKSGCLYSEMGNWSVAWRVHDAQFWGVPQRRKRIALVADFGGLAAPEVLFERKGLSGDSEQSGAQGEETAGAVGGGVEGASGTISFQERVGKPGGGKGILIQHEHVDALSTLNNQSVLQTREPILLESNQNHATVQTDGISTALPASMGMGGGYVPMITAYGIDQQGGKGGANYTEDVCPPILSDSHGTPHAVAYGISSYDSNAMKSPNPHSGIYEADTARTLDLNGGSPACNQGGIAVVQPSYCLQGNGIGRADNAGCNGKGWTEEVSYTLNTIDRPAVVQSVGCDVYNQEVTGEVAASLTAASGGTNTSGPKVLSCGFKPREGAQARSHGFAREISPTIDADGNSAVLCLNDQGGSVMAFAQNQVGEVRVSPMSGTLNTNSNATGRNSPLVYDARGNGDGEIVPTMTGDHQNRVIDYTAIVKTYSNQAIGAYAENDKASSIKQRDYKDATDLVVAAVDCRNLNENHEVVGTIQSKENGGYSLNYQNPVRINAIVRRLTPLECERLQGYPDGWTDIGEWTDSKGKKHQTADSARYKALGNSIALPFWKVLARRISAQYDRDITMGSLFDGIGGFPLAFEHCGGKAVWASEIEEFPIAVTKVRFKE